ncbi:Aspartate/glutamate/uridylate kinase [Coprinopsis sp. MPI-PUGE-AT-0042]|nr:Aspartate/glutamate/uridylate kinase [Coprinopsis sp. MPI-PUGE-AT-0042]
MYFTRPDLSPISLAIRKDSAASFTLPPDTSKPTPKLNRPISQWLVQKFGGTSVGKFPVKSLQTLSLNYLDNNNSLSCVQHVQGPQKALGTTSLLLKAATQALERAPKKSSSSSSKSTKANGGASTTPGTGANTRYTTEGCSAEVIAVQGAVQTRARSRPLHLHHEVVRRAVQDHARQGCLESVEDLEIRAELEDEIERDCEWLRSFLYAAKIIDEISPRSKDNIIGLGEKLACKLMAAILRDQGIDAEYVSLEEIVPASYRRQDPRARLYDSLASAIAERIEQCDRRVPVVTGFFGPVPGSLLAQIGRGYTDLCSALIAAGLDARWMGIFTADPRKVPTARLIPVISPDEAAELTYYGSEVVHPFVMEQKDPNSDKEHPDADSVHPAYDSTSALPEPASSSALSQYAVSHHHTVSSSPLNGSASPKGPPRTPSLSSITGGYGFDDPNNRRLPTAVTIKEHIMVLNVHSNRKSVSHGFLAGIFGTLDRFGVVVDLISTSEVHVSMAIADGLGKRVLDGLMGEMKRHGAVSIHREMAILSLVGKQMRNMVDGNVNIEMISQGASEINISCVIDSRDAVKALNIIHQSCLMIRPEGPRGRGSWASLCRP